MSAKNSSSRRAESVAKATAQTRSAIEGLKERLTGEAHAGATRYGLKELFPGQSHDGETRYVASVQTISTQDCEPQETDEELERQLQAYFACATPAQRKTASVVTSGYPLLMDELRGRVVDVAADRILTLWLCPEPGMPPAAGLGTELIDRLVQRILEQLGKPAGGSTLALAS